MVQWLRVLVAYGGNQRAVPRTHTKQLTVTSSSSSGASDNISWSPQHYSHTHILVSHIWKIKMITRILKGNKKLICERIE